MSNFYVDIRRLEDDHVELHMGPFDERKAEKVADGAGINLDWDNWTIDVYEEEQDDSL